MSVEGQRCLCVVVLLIHTVTGAGEGPSSPSPSTSSSSIKPDQNELTVTFPPLEDIYSHTPEKHFGTENNTLVTSQTGSTALLPCVIRNIGDGIVSWIRRKDYHLLTVGLTTYSSDQRFQAIHLQHSEDWTLKVRFVQKRDAGIYECQVSSHPPTSIFLRLEVVEARAQISGPTEKYLKPGSTLRLQCSVVQTTEAPAFVFCVVTERTTQFTANHIGTKPVRTVEQQLSDVHNPSSLLSKESPFVEYCSHIWTGAAKCYLATLDSVERYHNSRMINYDVERGINVTTDPVQRLSDLLIPAASVAHAGNYTCVPNNAVPASIYVHIFNGENPAAMQSSSPTFISRLPSILLPTLISLKLIR